MKTFKTICTVIVLTVTGLGLLGFGGIKLILALEEVLDKLLEDIQASGNNERQ